MYINKIIQFLLQFTTSGLDNFKIILWYKNNAWGLFIYIWCMFVKLYYDLLVYTVNFYGKSFLTAIALLECFIFDQKHVYDAFFSVLLNVLYSEHLKERDILVYRGFRKFLFLEFSRFYSYISTWKLTILITFTNMNVIAFIV